MCNIFELKKALHDVKTLAGMYEKLSDKEVLEYHRLAEYEDLEEQGKILKLPYAVGDTVYTLNPLPGGKTVIGETTADTFMCALGMLEGKFGKTIFLSLEEAESALKEMTGKG